MSVCEAPALYKSSRPSATTAAAVSSQEDSIPRIRVLIDLVAPTISNSSSIRGSRRQTQDSAKRFPPSPSEIPVCRPHRKKFRRKCMPTGRLPAPKCAARRSIGFRFLLPAWCAPDNQKSALATRSPRLSPGLMALFPAWVLPPNRGSSVTSLRRHAPPPPHPPPFRIDPPHLHALLQ